MNRNVVKKEKESKGTKTNPRGKRMLLRAKSRSKLTSVNYIFEPYALGYFSS